MRVFRVSLLSHSTVCGNLLVGFSSSLGGVSLIKGKKTAFFFRFFFFLRVFFSSSRLSGHKKKRELSEIAPLIYFTSKRSPYAHFHNT